MQNSERLQILRMVASGDMSVDEAVGMMGSSAPAPALSAAGGAPQWLRVRVSNLETGAARVSVNFPMRLIRWGMRWCSRFAPELEEVDLEQVVKELGEYGGGHIVDVQDAVGNERVEIFVE